MSEATQLAYPHLAARVFDTPLLIEQNRLNTILHVLGPRLDFDCEQDGPAVDAEELVERSTAQRYERMVASMALPEKSIQKRAEGYYVVGDVAIVPVIGTLVHRSSWMDAMSGMTSYARVARMMAAAQNDYTVRSIVAEFDTAGGEVSGAFDSADRLFAMRGQKKVYAVVSELAASGGYLLASTADRIFVPRTGIVGSIGVAMSHMDMSKALEKRGVAVTYVYAGERKIDRAPSMPLSDSARADMQSKADGIYQLFVDSVARNIGLSADKVRATQAAMYMGATGVEMGLAHEVGSFEEVLQMAVRQAGPFRLDGQAQEIFMTASDKGNGGPVQITAEQLEAARTEGHAAGLSAGRAETAPAVTAAVTAERSRIQGIVTHAEATGRAELAAHLAFETDMAADQATALLAKSPKAQAGSPLDRAMAAEGGAHVAAQPGPEPTSTQPVIDANDIFARRAAAAKQKR